jgi:hypothetical protein
LTLAENTLSYRCPGSAAPGTASSIAMVHRSTLAAAVRARLGRLAGSIACGDRSMAVVVPVRSHSSHRLPRA